MTDIVRGMAIAGHKRHHPRYAYSDETEAYRRNMEATMRAALLWLADNVSHDMVVSAAKAHEATPLEHGASAWMQEAISAAIRAAAGGGP
jgi:hypothetical protein